MIVYVRIRKQSALHIVRLARLYILLWSPHKKRILVAFYGNKFHPQQVLELYFHLSSTIRFPRNYLSAWQSYSHSRSSVYSLCAPHFRIVNSDALHFLSSKNKNPVFM